MNLGGGGYSETRLLVTERDSISKKKKKENGSDREKHEVGIRRETMVEKA